MTSEGGKKYVAPSNMEVRRELASIVKVVDIPAFRQFISARVPELSNWLYAEDKDLTLLIHHYRATLLGLGESCAESRNYLRSIQFNYTPEEAAGKPHCFSCVWFENVPDGSTHSCMHLGSLPSDVACPVYDEAKKA